MRHAVVTSFVSRVVHERASRAPRGCGSALPAAPKPRRSASTADGTGGTRSEPRGIGQEGPIGSLGFVVDLAPAGSEKRRQVGKRGFRTKAEALDELLKVQNDIRQGSYIAPSKQTLEEFLTEWLKAIKPTIRPST